LQLQIFSDLHADVARPRTITVAADINAAIVAFNPELVVEVGS
jgi:hypothetical protein